MTSTFRIQQGNGSGAEKDTPNPSDQESQFREVSRERADALAENSATPMDLDATDPKEES
jgi:solute carrier family 25 phosphate transporter 3